MGCTSSILDSHINKIQILENYNSKNTIPDFSVYDNQNENNDNQNENYDYQNENYDNNFNNILANHFDNLHCYLNIYNYKLNYCDKDLFILSSNEDFQFYFKNLYIYRFPNYHPNLYLYKFP